MRGGAELVKLLVVASQWFDQETRRTKPDTCFATPKYYEIQVLN